MVHFFFRSGQGGMEIQQTKKRLEEILIPLCAENGLQLWGISLSGKAGHKKTLRVFIDSEKGADIEQCSAVSRELSVILDAEEIIAGAYTLEVSSPGLERLFFSLDQMLDYIGKTIKIECLASTPGRKHYTGTLKAVEEENFLLEVDGQDTRLQWDTVKKARLVYPFVFPNT